MNAGPGSQGGGECSKTCVSIDCDTAGLKYGKYCGLGHTGCKGEKPCDSVDACCMKHDACVGDRGMLADSCHEEFEVCLKKNGPNEKGFPGAKCDFEQIKKTMPEFLAAGNE